MRLSTQLFFIGAPPIGAIGLMGFGVLDTSQMVIFNLTWTFGCLFGFTIYQLRKAGN